MLKISDTALNALNRLPNLSDSVYQLIIRHQALQIVIHYKQSYT